jgi:phage baseplate assembly protein W
VTAPSDDRLAQLLTAPLGCAFLLTARQADLTMDELLEPGTSLDVAAAAQSALDPWNPRAEEARAEVLDIDEEDADLAARVVADPRTAWWWHTGALPSQVLVTGSEHPPPEVPGDAARGWEAYAQRSVVGIFTATRFGATSGMHAEVANDVGDWDPQYPLTEHDIEVADGARVFHVTGAADWHRLATTFPAPMRGSDAAGVVNEVSPDWRLVAEQWDGVHLTFGGLLCALFVPVTSEAGTTTLWTWESERTLWLHRPFTTQRQGRTIVDELQGDRHLWLECDRPSGTPDRAWLVARKEPFWRRWFQRR